MESFNSLNLRVGECSFLETVLIDVRRFIKIFDSENKKHVLVFPPLSARNRFLIHNLVQNFFNELNTISIGSSYGRRTVVYHSSLKPMLRETESEQPNEIVDQKNNDMHQAYRTPIERKAQEQLFKSLMPEKKGKQISRAAVRTKSKRPDIPIYIPRAMRVLANNIAPNISNTANSLNSTLITKRDTDCKIQDESSSTPPSKERKGSFPQFNLNNTQNNCKLDLLLSLESSNEMLVDCCESNKVQNSFNNISPRNSLSSSSSDLSNCLNTNECNPNSFVPNEIIKPNSPVLKKHVLDSYIKEKPMKNCDNVSISLNLPCSSDNLNDTCSKNSNLDKSPDSKISNIDNTVKPNVLKPRSIRQSMMLNVIDNTEETVVENIDKSETQNNEICLGNELMSDSQKLEIEYDSNCPNFCLDDSFGSGPLSEIEEKSIKSVDEKLTVQDNSGLVNKPLTSFKQNVQQENKKKKVLDIDECSWEDLYDKEDDYIHPILVKELSSAIGKVQVQCTKEDYRSHQTAEERSGDGECIIEVYDFSSDLKTVDLMNQFAAFRKNHFEIIWINDTHALAVFENPNLADRALNTPFALVKTRPLKRAIRESKIRAETVSPLPATRPKTCTAMARRLVGSALGLKVNVPHHRLNAERTLLADAKEKKIRDAQQKTDIWDSLS
ncbi:R3H domain [Cinara cedri]|uniref:R3H domain n=1 Tax=Cinara cedri TaxID=506608 RepID=A0A5E4NL31_9HEMI|nr:R3H domain [Cinara cedri]